MFGKKEKNEFSLKQAQHRLSALEAIKEALEEQESKFELGVSNGLIDMAFLCEAITLNERAAFKTEAYRIDKEKNRK